MCMNIFLILMNIFLHEKDRKKETKKQRKNERTNERTQPEINTVRLLLSITT